MIEEFHLELERTRLAFPGVEQRQCSLEKTSFLIEERLLEALNDVRSDAAELVSGLLYGNEKFRVLDREDLDPLEIAGDPAYLCGKFVSPSLVQEGARVLGGLDAEALFINDRVWALRSFERWRRLYRNAAAEGEALMGGVC